MISRWNMIFRVSVVLNRSVVDSDWHLDNLCSSNLQSQSVLYHVSWWYYTLVIDLIGQFSRYVIGRLSVKPAVILVATKTLKCHWRVLIRPFNCHSWAVLSSVWLLYITLYHVIHTFESLHELIWFLKHSKESWWSALTVVPYSIAVAPTSISFEKKFVGEDMLIHNGFHHWNLENGLDLPCSIFTEIGNLSDFSY